MKYFATILFVAFLCQNLTEAQTPTYAGLPGPENVLVVFKAPSDTSDSLGIISQAIASYYKTKRNMPSENIIFPGLRLPDTTFSVDGVAHTVGLGQVSDNIRDFDNHSSGTWYATEHAWKYFYQFIALPIKNYLTQHNLTNQIRYIVLCKGVPFKVQAAGDSSAICNVTVDGLLCMLNTNTGGSYENFLHNLYTEYRAHAIPDTSYAKEFIPNPYYNVDPYLTMDYRFVSDRFTGNWKNLNIKLSYLVSHLDGISKQNVYDIIDRSKDADTTNDGWWIIDDDPTLLGAPSHTYMYNAQEYLNELTPNVVYNTSDTWIVDNYDNNDGPVMGYTSWGIHAEDNNPNWHDSTWWVDTLDFQYANGAVAISNESFNGNSLTTLVWRSGHGLITQFTEQNLHNSGGAGFSGNAWEPFDENITQPDIYFPAYAAGYNQVDAAYMGTKTLAWENIFLGDPLTQIGQIVTIDTLVGTLQADVNNTKVVIPVNGTLTIPNGTNLNILNFGGIKVWGKLIIGSNTSMKVFNHGLIKVEEGGEIVFGNNSRIQTYDESIVDSKGRITCDLGVQINNGSTFKVANEFFTRGTESSPVNIYSGLSFNDIDSLVVKWTNFHNSNIDIANNYRKGLLDIEFSDFINSTIGVTNFDKVNILNDNFNNVLTAVAILESHTSNIKNNVFNDCKYGIVSKPSPHEINSSDSLFIVNCSFKKISNLLASPNGIFITNVDTEFTYLKIDSCSFEGCANSISLNKFDHCSPIISNCTITNYESYGISLTNGSSVIINGNNISTSNSAAVDPIGIYLSQVTNPYILEDTITTDLSNPGSGIVSVSSSGYYRSNIISGYYNGVELGNSSSPDMALNEIYHNINYGIFISTGSNPKLNKLTSGDSHYPLAGYNAIYENGESTELSDDPEIYINTANIQLSKGCNTIADDRYIAPPYDHKILMDGQNVRYKITADSNYWGYHPIYGYNPAQRFGNQITVKYAPYDTVPCTYSPDNSRMLVLTTTTGAVADTVYSDGTLAGQLSSIQSNYASANQYFYSGNYNDAENTYKQIINLSEDSTYSIEAYNKLYLIKKYQNANLQGYENLRQYYQGKLPSIEDTSILLVVNNLIDMCRVSKDEYEQAIASFDETAQNNQGTDIELYNEINALTTSLLVDTTSGLGKANLSKYKSRDISEYLKNVNEVLKSRRKNVESDKNKLIPAKYILYQNYPNPFNPTTTIKYAVPKSVNVELKIFDILGREVKTLINETRNPGYYEVQFNANNLASGIYFYRLRAGDYIKTSKMLLVK